MFSFDKIESFKSIATPFYYYDLEVLRQNLNTLRRFIHKYNIKVHYALKANANLPVLKLINEFGLGADCVSGNEIKRAIQAGFSPNKIVYAGVGKTDDEIKTGLENRIACFNVESIHELEVINDISKQMGLIAPVALRINPDVNGHTFQKITTGTRFDKFGISKDEIPEVLRQLPKLSHISFEGLHFHIGSQITNMDVFSEVSKEVNIVQKAFNENGFTAKSINLGGGLGIDYSNPDQNPIPDYENYFQSYLGTLNLLPTQHIHFELGRSITANCGSLISKVLFLKSNNELSFAVLDAGMNDLMRPALYGAEHKIQNLTAIGKDELYQVVGPICESSDVFGRDIKLPSLKRGDLIAIRSTGAYGEVMASAYNLRSPAPAIYADDFGFMNAKKIEG